MKNSRFLFLCLMLSTIGLAQKAPTYKITYLGSSHGKVNDDQDPQVLLVNKKIYRGSSRDVLKGIAEFPYEEFFVDFAPQPAEYHKVAYLSKEDIVQTLDTNFLAKYEYRITEEEKEILGFACRKAVTSINSNNIELWYTTQLPFRASPVLLGQELGVVLEYVRNGNAAITASKIEKVKTGISVPKGKRVDASTFQDVVWKSKFIRVPVFDKEQVNFVKDPLSNDSVQRFANGTVILRQVHIPKLERGTQGFVQAVQRSLGDAYDRTASVFLIREGEKEHFLKGMALGMDSIATYQNGDGKVYKGMVATENFEPTIELMRFFTPFGVNHFNDKVRLKGKKWQDSVLYRQDISELVDALSGTDVYIGAFIGNYDQGGHELSLELTFHPGWNKEAVATSVLPLFNTTSVMEMGGQGYPTMFKVEKGLKVAFNLEKDIKNAQLRYIATGHGGWGGGDEFNQKLNSIYLDGELQFSFIPWRTDCGSYRLYNPVSGNFQNGLSSSDLSRSNWCPATVTPPQYIPLGNLSAGPHTIEIDIPQGPSEGNSFSYWNVSGVLLYEGK